MCLRDNFQGDLHSHPITANLQIFKQPGNGAAVPDVGGITVNNNLHACPHNPENRDKYFNETISAKTAEMVSNVLPASQDKCDNEFISVKAHRNKFYLTKRKKPRKRLVSVGRLRFPTPALPGSGTKGRGRHAALSRNSPSDSD